MERPILERMARQFRSRPRKNDVPGAAVVRPRLGVNVAVAEQFFSFRSVRKSGIRLWCSIGSGTQPDRTRRAPSRLILTNS
jgi:hypothetical protein